MTNHVWLIQTLINIIDINFQIHSINKSFDFNMSESVITLAPEVKIPKKLQ